MATQDDMKLKKSDLIEKLAADDNNFPEGTSDKQRIDAARDTVNLFFDSIVDSMKNGDRVEIRGFGSFNIKEYEGYTGRNPRTGQSVEVQPKKLPAFRPGRELRRIVDK